MNMTESESVLSMAVQSCAWNWRELIIGESR